MHLKSCPNESHRSCVFAVLILGIRANFGHGQSNKWTHKREVETRCGLGCKPIRCSLRVKSML